MDKPRILITGANGQLGRALRAVYPDALATDSTELDITNKEIMAKFNWSNIRVIINAAAYTNVDGAETPEGEKLAWTVNDQAVDNLAKVSSENNITLIHISTAYVFDGQKKIYTENDSPRPLGIYAKSKAAGDEKASATAKHYIIRTDSVIGDGKNFVRTMLGLAEKGISPTVVADQVMRPTFATELAKAVKFIVDSSPDYGIYNLTNEGSAVSWADFTREIFKEANVNLKVKDTTLAEYSSGKEGVAPRPLCSVLDLSKIEAAGFKPRDWHEDLNKYIEKEMNK